MFKTSQELQQFIEWAKTQKIAKVKVKGVEVEFSPLAFIDLSDIPELKHGGANTIADDEPVDQKEDDDLLFASSNI